MLPTMRSRFVPLLLALVAGLVAWFALRAPEREPSFKVDEAEYLAMGLFSVEQWQGTSDATRGGLVAAPDPATWREGVHAVTFGFQSPGLPKVVFGTLAQAHLEPGTVVLPYVFRRFVPPDLAGLPPRTHRLSAREPLLPALEPARARMAGLAALAAALLALAAASIARTFNPHPVAGALAATVAVAGFLTSPAVREAANYVRPGLFPVLFTSAAVVVFLRAIARRDRRLALDLPAPVRLLGVAIGLGLCLGLATAGKLNGALLAAAIPFLVWPLRGKPGARAAAIVGAWAIGFGVFVLFAPGLWGNLVEGVRAILDGWRGDLAWQAEQYNGEVHVAQGRFDALRLSMGALLSSAGPFAAWVPFAGTLFGVLGIVGLGLGARRSDTDLGVFGFCVVLLVGSALVVPMERLRYFLPMVWPLALGAGLLVERLACGRRRAAED